jgi:hypothetical protein
MKRLVISAAIAAVVLGFGVEPSRAADPNVTIRIVDSSGNPVADGLTKVTEQFSNKSLFTVGGKAAFVLPNGKHLVSVRVVTPLIDGNGTYAFANFDIDVSGKTDVEIKLPSTMRVSFNLGKDVQQNGQIAFWLQGYIKDNTEGKAGGLRTEHSFKIKVGDTERTVRSSGAYVGFFEKTLNGYFHTEEISYLAYRGLRIRNGVINLNVFTPNPLSEMENLYSNPVVRTKYDFDNDGYMDYTYAYRFGASGWKTADISFSELNTGAVTTKPIDGAVRVEVDAVPTSVKENSFTLKGRVISDSSAYLSVNSPISAYTIQQMPGFPFPYALALGKANVDNNGNFSLKVTLPSNQSTYGIVDYFFISTPLGTATLDFPLPRLVKKYKDCAAMHRNFSGGISKSVSSINKGSKIKLKPSVNPQAYELNKSLDRDKDGIACER